MPGCACTSGPRFNTGARAECNFGREEKCLNIPLDAFISGGETIVGRRKESEYARRQIKKPVAGCYGQGWRSCVLSYGAFFFSFSFFFPPSAMARQQMGTLQVGVRGFCRVPRSRQERNRMVPPGSHHYHHHHHQPYRSLIRPPPLLPPRCGSDAAMTPAR